MTGTSGESQSFDVLPFLPVGLRVPCMACPGLFQRLGDLLLDSDDVTAGRMLCARCPVQAECRAHALETPEVWGMWGGLTHKEREAMHKARARTHKRNLENIRRAREREAS